MQNKTKILVWIGRGLTALIAAALTFSAVMKFANPPGFSEQWVDKFGYPANLALAIGIVEITCVVIYLIPQTAVLGAVLLTGYLGGAIATHVRVNDGFIPVVVMGVLVWLALFLRDERLRQLLPIRKPKSNP
jgi:uncharacterized membrane protein YphA (DoxX/SURF4 family)